MQREVKWSVFPDLLTVTYRPPQETRNPSHFHIFSPQFLLCNPYSRLPQLQFFPSNSTGCFTGEAPKINRNGQANPSEYHAQQLGMDPRHQRGGLRRVGGELLRIALGQVVVGVGNHEDAQGPNHQDGNAQSLSSMSIKAIKGEDFILYNSISSALSPENVLSL